MIAFFKGTLFKGSGKKLLPVAAALACTLLAYGLFPSPEAAEEPPPVHADSLVPEGHVLVPIEVANMEALESLVGPFGMVDLYAPGEEGKALRKVGSRMKMVRSPEQPSFISLLVPEKDALKLLTEEGPFRVTVLNPSENQGSAAVHKKASSRIHYQDH